VGKAISIDSLYISDVHLGSRGTQAEELLEVLKKYKPKRLFIVGDFIDGWLLKHRHHWPQSHTNVIRKILSYSKSGTQVFYITGNHDDFLRAYDHLDWGNIQILNEYIDETDWIIHGDLYDSVVLNNRLLSQIGGIGYEWLIGFDRIYKKIRHTCGLPPRSLSKWAKHRVKSAANFIQRFETTLAQEAKARGCSRVICGHLHTPAQHKIDTVEYLNTGDWIESLTWITRENGEYTLHAFHNSNNQQL